MVSLRLVAAALALSLLAPSALARANATSCSADSSSDGDGGGWSGGDGGSSDAGGATPTSCPMDWGDDGAPANAGPSLREAIRGTNFVVSVTTRMRAVDLSDVTLAGTSTHFEQDHRYRMAGALGDRRLLGVGLELGANLRGPLYGRVGLDIYGRRLGARADSGDLVVHADSIAGAAVRGALGLRLGLGALSLRAEVAGAAGGAEVRGRTVEGDCVNEIRHGMPLLSLGPRLGVDWFFRPRLALALSAGADLLTPGTWDAALGLDFHGLRRGRHRPRD